MREKEKGSITVFLSLILLLILAVTMTTIEAARVNAAKTCSERAMTASMDSLLAEYYLPLFQEYDIFGLDGGYGTDSVKEETMANKMKEYMDYTFHPDKDLYLYEEYLPVKGVNLLDLDTEETGVKDVTTLLDYDGELFANQAVAYMKYKEVGNILERFGTYSKEISSTQNALTVLDKKQETEQSLYGLDEKIIDLMRLSDGIAITGEGVKLDGQGNIRIEANFIKKICTFPPTKENLSLNNDWVFASLKGHYCNTEELIGSAVGDCNSLIINLRQKEAAWEAYEAVASVSQLNIKDKEALAALHQAIAQARSTYEYYVKQEAALLQSLNTALNTLNELVEGTLASIYRAMPMVDNLILEQNKVTVQLEDYENVLTENKNGLEESLYTALEESLEKMQVYKNTNTSTGDNNNFYNFALMKETLQTDGELLAGVEKYGRAAASEGSLEALIESLTATKARLSGYSHKGLQFDYSTLAKPVESDSFFTSIRNLLENGFMELVTDTDKLSKKELEGNELPTYLNKIAGSSDPADLSEKLAHVNLLEGMKSFGDFFTSGENKGYFTDFLLGGTEAFGETMLLQEYIVEHFASFGSENTGIQKKALDYEAEYILTGKKEDYKNLQAVVMKILFLRAMMNFITLMSDSKSSNEARTMAITFVGFTGLPALVALVTGLILFIWGFCEALVDTAALLEGRKVPFLKNGTNLQLGLQDIFLMNKAYIKEKAGKIKDDGQITSLDYEDYIRLFLFAESRGNKSYRAMDLIQENLQLNYEESFYLKNCIFGFRADSRFTMEEKFTAFPFIRRMWGYQEGSYVFETLQEYSY